MNSNEMRSLLKAAVEKHVAELDGIMAKLPPTAKNERKACAIQKSLAGIFTGSFNWVPDNSKRQQTVFFRLHYFDGCKEKYDSLTPMQQEAFLVFAYPFSVISSNLLACKRREIGKEESAEKAFENKIAAGFLEMLLREWLQLWNENGSFRCEVKL